MPGPNYENTERLAHKALCWLETYFLAIAFISMALRAVPMLKQYRLGLVFCALTWGNDLVGIWWDNRGERIDALHQLE